MSFNAKAVNIGALNTTLFECPATLSGSVHGLVISNISAAPVTLILRFYDHSEGTTTLIKNTEVAAKGEFVFPKPINVTPGDRIIASASVTGALVSLHSVYLSDAAPVSAGFNARGEWNSSATYQINDVVTYDGSSYVAVSTNTSSQPPSASWMLSASKGDKSGVHTVHGVAPDDNNDVEIPLVDAESSGVMAPEDKVKLDGIEAHATKNATDNYLLDRANHTGLQTTQTIEGLDEALLSKAPLNSPKFTGSVTGITQDMVGLGNVNNTSDEDKPVSAAVRVELDTKEDNLPKGGPDQYLAGDKTFKTIQASQIEGLEEAITFVDDLTSTDAGKALSANQGRVLKELIDTINSLLQSDDATLDELQEIVDFIKLNREDLDTLSIPSIAGLETALAGKQPLNTILTGTSASFTSELKAKLDDVAVQATKNETDAYLLDRANHTGTQPISTIADLEAALESKANSEHTHALEDVEDLLVVLETKLSEETYADRGDLGSTDLNDVRTPGLYWQADPEEVSVALNYPEDGVSGVVEVITLDAYTTPYPVCTQRFTTNEEAQRIFVRRGDVQGEWGTWAQLAFVGESGGGGQETWSGEVWGAQPIGSVFPLWDDIDGCPLPPNDPEEGPCYVKLTASDTAYNGTLLTNQTVSGTAPTINATAVISLARSPLHNQTIRLINTEGRFVRPGTSSGTLQNSENLSHSHGGSTSSAGSHSHDGTTSSAGSHSHSYNLANSMTLDLVTGGVSLGLRVNGNTANSTNSTGSHSHTLSIGSSGSHSHSVTLTASGGSEARPRNISATYYMRIA